MQPEGSLVKKFNDLVDFVNASVRRIKMEVGIRSGQAQDTDSVPESAV